MHDALVEMLTRSGGMEGLLNSMYLKRSSEAVAWPECAS
jgi:hypothetical protein